MNALFDKIRKHELTIFSFGEVIAALPVQRRRSASTRESDASDGFIKSTAAALQADLCHYKDLFSKLRFSYLEQVTKEKFLRSITDDRPSIVEQTDINELERELGLAKNQLQNNKDLVGVSLKRLGDLSIRLSDECRMIIQGIAENDELSAEVPELRGRSEAKIQCIQNTEGLLPLSDTKSKITDVLYCLGDLKRELEDIERELPVKEKQLDALANELIPMESDKEGLERYASEAVRKRDVAKQSGKAEREARGQWYKNSYEALSLMLE